MYEKGEVIPDPDPCETCHCDDGQKSCVRDSCVIPACGPDDILVFVADQCCPVCQPSTIKTLTSSYTQLCSHRDFFDFKTVHLLHK